MPRIRPLAAALLVLTAACYKVTVITAPEPTGARVVDKPWANSFVYGLVPPADIDVSAQCRGVSRVVTQRSFLNSLVGDLTFGIYTPMQVTTTCAASRTASQPGLPLDRLGYLAPAAVVPDSTRTTH
ncbi:MAG TPA: hypothetical protein VGD56_11040 [Gemmatirosa sp.]